MMRASERWFRLLLRLYPADFRDEMGADLIETYRDRLRDASKLGGIFRVAIVWSSALRDSLRNGLGERLKPAVSWRRGGDWGRDMELVTRRLRRTPLFAFAVLGTLTVGLGAFAVVYTAVDKILLEPLPYRDPQDLYTVWEKARNHNSVITGPVVGRLDKAGGAIEGGAGFRFGPLTIPAGDDKEAMRIIGMQTSPNLFDLLGVQPALGRGFRPDETGPKSPDVIVLTDGLWKRLGGNPAIIGTEIKIGASPFTVIGVMSRGFQFTTDPKMVPDAYIPLYVDLAAELSWAHNFRALIRARRGASTETLRAAVEAVGRVDDEGDTHQGESRRFYPVALQADIVNEVRPALLALSFAVVFLVLVLTVNLASLLLARTAEREREFAVSRALGASSPAVVRATLVEGGLLGLIGGVAAVFAGVWGTRALVALGPPDLPLREAIVLDWSVAVVVVAVGVLLGLLAASVPAVWAARVSLVSLISAGAVRGGAGPGRMRRSLVVAQVALSLVLLSAGGLVVRSFERLLAADPGFRSEGVLTFSVGLGSWLFPKDIDSFAFQDRVDAALRSLPGVTAVSATTTLPLSGGTNITVMTMPAAPANTGNEDQDSLVVDRIFTRSGYLEAMGMRLLEGRGFEGARRDGVREALIDRHGAKRFFPDGSALGATVRCEGDSMTIVGIVEQARLHNLHVDGRPQLFVRAEDYENRRASNYVIRTDREPSALIPDVRVAIRQIDRRVPVSQMKAMDEIVADSRSRERISAILIAGLALGAVLLVAMGLFGMISGSVARRRGELAVRLALGATHQRVIRLVVGEGARLVAVGLLFGIPGIYVSGQAIQGLLIGVSPFDVPTLATVAVGLVAIALLACYLAARRVTAIDPDRLLREGN